MRERAHTRIIFYYSTFVIVFIFSDMNLTVPNLLIECHHESKIKHILSGVLVFHGTPWGMSTTGKG